ncbi:cyclic nucleotide-binding protein [Duganella sp. Leaf126]|uniref:Crp/Fnr family transcriptional regulator n=1 Tax=Duganella sp. Leaf126 TaxID=1736266 RepID=UPI0006F442C7|nr:Crp/Fnr family transcriptional regulator [Duganella sp. Leaf126]KQQ47708.1 cyclic nucleotide-binding protein [Duganella sp. Leaf126]
MYDEVSHLMAPQARHVSVRKGEYLQRSGELAQYIHWLHSGVARVGYAPGNGSEVTLYFRTDGQMAVSHDDILRAQSQEPAHNFVVAETAVQTYRFELQALWALTAQHAVLRDYYIKVSERGIMDQSRRLYLSVCPAQSRLEAFRIDYPGLEQRISQKVVASFLGITPQYMSQLLKQDAALPR